VPARSADPQNAVDGGHAAALLIGLLAVKRLLIGVFLGLVGHVAPGAHQADDETRRWAAILNATAQGAETKTALIRH